MADDESSESWRAFLAARLDERRGRRAFSFRSLAAKAGFQSPGYLQRLLDGSRNLSAETAGRLADALALSLDEREHFLDLVALALASDSRQRDAIRARLRARTFSSRSRELSASQSSLFRHWYTPLVWTLAPAVARRSLGRLLETRLAPLVNAGDIEKTLDTLIADGFLIPRNDAGELSHDDDLLAISTPVSSDVLGRFYQDTLGAFRRLLPRLPAHNRNVRVTTFTVPLSKLDEVRTRIRALHQELAALATEGNTGAPGAEPREPVAACQLMSVALFHDPLASDTDA